MASRRCRGRRFGWLAGLVVLAAGCGKPAETRTAVVRGSVSFHGHPLSGGTVVFVPQVERGTTGVILAATVGADGQYRLADGEMAVPAGWYRVAIADPPEWYGTELNGTAFPAALRRPDRSGIEREVRAGRENVLDFTIELTR